MATTTIQKSRQALLREQRAEKEPVDPKSLVLETGLGGQARPVPLRDQINLMIRNEIMETHQTGPLDWQEPEEEPDPMSIYELAVDIHENPTYYDELFAPAELAGAEQRLSDEELRDAVATRKAQANPEPAEDPPTGTT